MQQSYAQSTPFRHRAETVSVKPPPQPFVQELLQEVARRPTPEARELEQALSRTFARGGVLRLNYMAREALYEVAHDDFAPPTTATVAHSIYERAVTRVRSGR